MTSYISKYATDSGGIIKIDGVIAKKSVEFFAFLTSFSDNMTSNWNEESVYGRPDVIGTFQNTTRKISLGFDLPASNLKEAKDNLGKINKIKQFMYPAYSTSNKQVSGSTITTNALSLAKSPVVRLGFANLLHNGDGKTGLLGWIGSFSATPVVDMGMFNEDKQLFPKVYNITLDFTPQHEFDLGYKHDGTPITGSFTSFPYDGAT